MIIGPKYKIARRLGAGVFEKTQTAKFALSENRKKSEKKRGGPKTDYGIQMLEKQKARFSYALTEKQFSKYVKQSLAKKGANQQETLFQIIEMRLDNVILRSGLAHTRLFARQIASHGHIMVNGQRVTIPSYKVSVGDVISIRTASTAKPLFASLDERLKNYQAPSWLSVDREKRVVTVQGMPKLNTAEQIFDIGQVLEFYSR